MATATHKNKSIEHSFREGLFIELEGWLDTLESNIRVARTLEAETELIEALKECETDITAAIAILEKAHDKHITAKQKLQAHREKR